MPTNTTSAPGTSTASTTDAGNTTNMLDAADLPLTITIPTARRKSGLGNTTIWKLIGDGTLDTVRIGRRRLIVYGSLLRLLTPDSELKRRPGRPRKVAT